MPGGRHGEGRPVATTAVPNIDDRSAGARPRPPRRCWLRSCTRCSAIRRRADRAVGRLVDRSAGRWRRDVALALTRRASPPAVEPERARPRPGVRRGRPRCGRRHLRVGRRSSAAACPRTRVSCSGCCRPPCGRRAGSGVLGRPLPPPPEEARLHGGRHSVRRDAAAIEHHYDVGNDFYRLVLGPSMTYSCARFVDDDDRPHGGAGGEARPHLPQARAGRDARRPAARRRVRLGLDGDPRRIALRRVASSASRSARRRPRWRAERVADAGLADRVEIRLQDYRDIGAETFDAISSIGMSEHVGHGNLARYYELLHAALRPAAGCSTTPSARSAARSSAGRRSSGATCSPTAS